MVAVFIDLYNPLLLCKNETLVCIDWQGEKNKFLHEEWSGAEFVFLTFALSYAN